ncbi:Uncharacterized protein PECH_005184 [Penicillium ucsense]|uniref:Borealin N-terminal domain-containing protein n=1 Tax=Penicillium ucsense TaxID=2839758 RepID=A0A8J8WKA2_9EURO|nr:Uncharacterized protein PECM_005408 [Penicillium ucsense]KAF7736556.1 Uncharacterized protein PECH_005184 [Penicillium ucsense]
MATLKRKAPELSEAPDATPTGRPVKKLRLTRSQKQALIDNLQLEITERARKLRAQYALQAHDLRARLERRVNRIPVSLRKANMGELFEKYAAATQATSPIRRISPIKAARAPISIDQALSPSSTRDGRTRRTSNDGYSDKENAPAAGTPEGLKNPKRRGKAPPASGTSRIVSQEMRSNNHRILSPKSSNSRTYPQSPFRASPEKGQPSYLSRPISPLKPSSPLRAPAPGSRPRGATTSNVRDVPLSSQIKKTTARSATGPRAVNSPLPRPATRQGERKNSFSSTTSSGTTVAKQNKPGLVGRKATTGTAASTKKPPVPRAHAASLAVKKPTAATAASAVRKTTAPASTLESSTRATRALRKRV